MFIMSQRDFEKKLYAPHSCRPKMKSPTTTTTTNYNDDCVHNRNHSHDHNGNGNGNGNGDGDGDHDHDHGNDETPATMRLQRQPCCGVWLLVVDAYFRSLSGPSVPPLMSLDA